MMAPNANATAVPNAIELNWLSIANGIRAKQKQRTSAGDQPVINKLLLVERKFSLCCCEKDGSCRKLIDFKLIPPVL